MSMLKTGLVCLFCFFVAITVQGQEFCTDYDFAHDTLPNIWVSAKDHINGSHSVASYFHNLCAYDDVAEPPATCDVQQYLTGFASVLESGSVGGFLRFHQVTPITKTGQNHALGASATTAYVGAGVWSCSLVGGGCGNIGISIPPITLSGPNQVESFQADGMDYCPSRRSHATAAHCADPPCKASPLIANLSGLGPFKLDAPGSENNIFQLTDINHGIAFDLLNTGHSQKIAWLRPGSHMAVLVLPNSHGKVVNGDQTFGTSTRCALDKRCGDGFIALGYKCDDAINGGNNDGRCDKNDAAFSKLRWMVRLKSGKHRLYTMEDFGIQTFDVLVYQELTGKLRILDSNENVFAFKGTFDAGWKAKAGGYQSQLREIYDVMLGIRK